MTVPETKLSEEAREQSKEAGDEPSKKDESKEEAEGSRQVTLHEAT